MFYVSALFSAPTGRSSIGPTQDVATKLIQHNSRSSSMCFRTWTATAPADVHGAETP